jgi:hypothetical protein
MHNDGRTYIWIPSALTLSFLTLESAAFINAIHAAINEHYGVNYKKTDYAPGLQPHEYYLLMNDLDMGGAPFTRDVATWEKLVDGEVKKLPMAVCGPIENTAYLSPEYAEVIIAFGGDIEGMPVFFELDDITQPCPFSDSNETWETWGVFGESHKPVQLGDKWYRSSNVGESGTVLLASQWVPYRQAGGVVRTVAEYQVIQAENPTGPR